MIHYQRITFIIPCRNNLVYLKQAINSIENNYGNKHDIIVLDDASTDGTWDWIKSYAEGWDYIFTYRNDSGERVGHTVLYDIGIEMAETPIVTILHSDMIVTKNYVSNMLKHLKPLTVVSGTRVEPPLHPPGPEKYVREFGMEPDVFNHNEFKKFVESEELVMKDKTTNGIFAPWMLYKEDFTSIGGHDKLFAPMELEDSDIFNRFHLNGYQLIQSRDAFVYHMTCRGSRFKDGIQIEQIIDLPDGTKWYKAKDTEEYLQLREIKFREWWRKWHTDVLHDSNMMPIVPKRYPTSFIVEGCTPQLLSLLEPWCDDIYVDCESHSYIISEDLKSNYNIANRVHSNGDDVKNNIHNKFDGFKVTQQHFQTFIKNIPFIVQQTDSLGSFEWDIFQIHILNLNTMNMIQPFFKNVF
jgi:glycosyltransferase involved in cell wall biosynthesis